MRVASQGSANIVVRRHTEQSSRRSGQLSAPSTVEATTSNLRFWRPLSREIADVICGEGTVADTPVHTHEALQITLPASRFAIVDGRRASVAMQPGQLHVAAPLELHGVRRIDDGPCAMRVLLVSPTFLRTLGDVSGLWRGASPGRQQTVVEDPALFAALWALIGEMRGPLVSVSCSTRLLACLGRLLTAIAAQPASGATRQRTAEPPGLGRVCEHLRAHVDASVSLDDLANVAALSRFYLLRAFRTAYGATPHEYQMQLRLAHAWRLIVDGFPLTRATYDAGFADQSHLTRRFAAAFGTTPARYARQLAMPPGAASTAAVDVDLSFVSPSSAA